MKQWTPEEIKDFRKGRGLYQKELALMLRVTTRYVSMIERGDRTPSDTMRALLDCIEEKKTKKEGKGHGKGNL